MAEETVQANPTLPNPPAETPSNLPFDVGDTDLHFERARDDKGRFAPAEPVAPAAPKHPAYLVERATDCGLDADDLDALSTDQLNKLCWKMTQQQLRLRDQNDTARTLDSNTVRAPAPAAPAAPAAEDFDWGVGDDGQPLTEKDFHPGLAKFMKSQHREIKELKAKLDQERTSNQQRELKRSVDVIDAAFAKLNDERLFGKGPAAAMGPDQKAFFKRRIAVLTEAGVDLNNINRATIVQQIKEAADLLYAAPKADPKADPKTDPYAAAMKPISVKEWNNGAVAQPTGRKGGAEPKGEVLAVKNLADKMRERGLLAEPESDSEIDDGLLG